MTYLEPLLPIFFFLAFVGLVRVWRGGGPKPVALTAGLAGLFLVSWPPAEYLFSELLIRPYANTRAPRAAEGAAIVIFSAGIEAPATHLPFPMPDTLTHARCRYAAWLYHNRYALPVLVSGGVLSPGHEPAAETMARLLRQEGIPPEQIWMERNSRDTHENAMFSAEILRSRGIRRAVLVVEAASMARAERALARQGIEVLPAPVRLRSTETTIEEWKHLLPSWKAVRNSERTLHEIGGLLWYRLRGWI